MTTKQMLFSALILAYAPNTALASKKITKQEQRRREFRNAAINGDVTIITQILNSRPQMSAYDKNKALKEAIISTYPASERNVEYLNVASELINNGGYIDADAFYLATSKCNHEMLQLLYDKANLATENEALLLGVAREKESQLKSHLNGEEDIYHRYAKSVLPHCQITIAYLKARNACKNSQK